MDLHFRGNGNMDSYKAQESIMEGLACIKDNGNGINHMVSVYKPGKMVVNIMDIFKMGKNMEKELINGQITQNTKENGTKDKFQVKEHIDIRMEDFIQVASCKIKCMEKAPTHGPMAENMSDSTVTTKNKDMECTIGQMEDTMKANGVREKGMDMGK